MSTFHLKIASPDGSLFDGAAVKVTLRGSEGELAVMAGHAPFITSVRECGCHVETPDGDIKSGHTNGGLLTVADNTAALLSGSFEWD